MLYKKQEKSDHWVVIPLRHEAKLIFTRQFKEKIPALTNPAFNRHIKTIGKLAGITKLVKFSYKKGNKSITTSKPKFDWITTHTARRSFCTNEFLAATISIAPIAVLSVSASHKKFTGNKMVKAKWNPMGNSSYNRYCLISDGNRKCKVLNRYLKLRL